MTISDYKRHLLKDPLFRKEYERYDLTLECSELIVDMRVHAGLTQDKLAKRAKTKQPAIARIERGNGLPSLSFLQRLAHAAGGEIYVEFRPRKNKTNPNDQHDK